MFKRSKLPRMPARFPVWPTARRNCRSSTRRARKGSGRDERARSWAAARAGGTRRHSGGARRKAGKRADCEGVSEGRMGGSSESGRDVLRQRAGLHVLRSPARRALPGLGRAVPGDGISDQGDLEWRSVRFSRSMHRVHRVEPRHAGGLHACRDERRRRALQCRDRRGGVRLRRGRHDDVRGCRRNVLRRPRERLGERRARHVRRGGGHRQCPEPERRYVRDGGGGNDGLHRLESGIFNGEAGDDTVSFIFAGAVFNGGDGADTAPDVRGTFNGGSRSRM